MNKSKINKLEDRRVVFLTDNEWSFVHTALIYMSLGEFKVILNKSKKEFEKITEKVEKQLGY